MSEPQHTESGEEISRGRSPAGSATKSRAARPQPVNTAAWRVPGLGSHGPCAKILASANRSKVLVFATPPGGSPDDLFRQRPSVPGPLRAFLGIGMATAALTRRSRRQGIRVKMVNGATLRGNEVSKVIYEDFLPAVLAAGKYQAEPEPRFVGHGLRDIPAALDAQMRGVSAEKIVVSLNDQ